MVSNTALIYNCVSHFKHIKSRLGRQEMGCAEFQNPDDFASQVINMALVVQSLSVEEAEQILAELYKDVESKLSEALAKLHAGERRIHAFKHADKMEGDFHLEAKTVIDQEEGGLVTRDHTFRTHKDVPDKSESRKGHTVTTRHEEGQYSSIDYHRTPSTPDKPGEVVIRDNKPVDNDESEE